MNSRGVIAYIKDAVSEDCRFPVDPAVLAAHLAKVRSGADPEPLDPAFLAICFAAGPDIVRIAELSREFATPEVLAAIADFAKRQEAPPVPIAELLRVAMGPAPRSSPYNRAGRPRHPGESTLAMMKRLGAVAAVALIMSGCATPKPYAWGCGAGDEGQPWTVETCECGE